MFDLLSQHNFLEAVLATSETTVLKKVLHILAHPSIQDASEYNFTIESK